MRPRITDSGHHAVAPETTYTVPENDAFWFNDDGTFTAHFGAEQVCADAPNRLHTTPEWNFLIRVYRPGPSVLDGSDVLPEVSLRSPT